MKIVFVHIGNNSSPTLFQTAEIAKATNPHSEICLITDQDSLIENFPGTIYLFDKSKVYSFLDFYIRKNKELKEVAGGYWLNTILRIFALMQVAELDRNEGIIHLESDVYLYVENAGIENLPLPQDIVSFPRLGKSRGIASILYSPNADAMERFLVQLRSLLFENPYLNNDMDLLGHALNRKFAFEFASVPNTAIANMGKNYLFDGAALGQYLLGVDPIHTAGSVYSGFQNSDYPADISKFHWSIPDTGRITISYEEVEYEVVNLHAHSKELIGIPDKSNPRWLQIIGEANGELPRIVSSREITRTHFAKPSIVNRLRIARKIGYLKQMKKYSQRKFPSLHRN